MLFVTLDLKKDKILVAHRVRNVKMRKRAKFRGNRLEHDRDIAFFSNFKMAAVRHLGFLIIQNFNGRRL